jgi:hypothetical protein
MYRIAEHLVTKESKCNNLTARVRLNMKQPDDIVHSKSCVDAKLY